MPTETFSCRIPDELAHSINARQEASQRPFAQLVRAAITYYGEHNYPPPPTPEPWLHLGTPRRLRLTPHTRRILDEAATKHSCAPSLIARHALRLWMSHTTPDTLGRVTAKGHVI